jgi:acyl transferase domain-containing protein/SAM-dependent methyltransferase/NAD(P)-dependent dehydrogenase (short-subunit alcohol dehydrogenase family)
MSELIQRLSRLSHKQLMLLVVDQQEKIEAARRRDSEPIAVVGIGCRFPGGADGPEQFWRLLDDGRDAVREVPADRWDIDTLFDPDPDAPARMSVRSGAFLDDIAGFDASFFGISPREAISMDPQQRLLLEVAWEALEHAGLAADRLNGSATSVFVGLCNSDYFQRLLQRGREEIDSYLASGNAYSVAAGRIAYALGLQGPAIAVDTSCSSSLVALHLACKSLRSGETSLALCGGVNLICAPETTIALSKAHMLAPDGRCKTFDASADGYARGEGCGIVVLRRLSDALANDERIFGVVLGTATNQDGRSGGLTVPNGRAQEAVIRAALADAGVEARDIDYVEAHGTGTSLGDPIEVRAIAAALATGRTHADPVTVGSVKTNIGHLEAAAGIAGFIKVLLSLQNGRIPPHLHFHQPSGHIDWSACRVAVEPQGRSWPRSRRRRVAGLSSFGFSGTNAHAVIAEAPPHEAEAPQTERRLHCLPLSARSDAALRALARRYVAHIEADATIAIRDLVYTAGVGRSHLPERLAVVGETPQDLCAALCAFLADKPHPALHRGTVVAGKSPDVVFMFTGQGAQHPGMAQLLCDTAPAFRAVIDEASALLGPDAVGRTLKSVLSAESTDGQAIHDTAWTQPALFAVECGLAQLWRSWGIEPAAVVGHSVGEYAAACVAGVFSFEDGLRLIAERGRLMGALPPGGRMASVFAAEDVVRDAIATLGERVCIAAINGPENVAISGDSDAVDAVLETLARRDIRARPLLISFAAHSPLVAPALDAMEACARAVPMLAPRVPVAWNLTGGRPLPAGAAQDGVFWRRHLREPVRFAEGLASLHGAGFRVFLEVGPHPTLTALAQQSLPAEGASFLWSLRRDRDDWAEMLHNLAELYVRGAGIDWTAVQKPYGGRRIALPTYPFEHRPYWVTPARIESRPPPSSDAADELFYEVAWQPAPSTVHAAPSLLPPQQFAAGLQHRFAALADRHGMAIYDSLLPELDRLSAQHVTAALDRLGFDWTRGRVFAAPDEARRLGVAARHDRLFVRMVDMLIEDGALRRSGDWFEVVAKPMPREPAMDHDALLARFATTDSELRILHRCGSNLSGVLRGEQDPLALLFPGGSFAEAGRLYRDSPFALTYNAALCDAVATAIAGLPADARLRILEIGAGTGGTTASLLKLLPADRTDYMFTDLSPRFLQQAAEQFAGCQFMRRALLDIERDPAEQGFATGGWDIVIAANVLHATSDLRQALRHVRGLLAPGGLLLMLEGVLPERWVDLTFGLTEGWWRFTDTALRPSHPLIGRGVWTGLLSEVGFTDMTAVPDNEETQRGCAQQALIVARASPVGQCWTLVGDTAGIGGALAARLRARGDSVKTFDAEDDADPPEGTLVYLGALQLADRSADDPWAPALCKDLACSLPLRWLARLGAGRAWLATRGAQPAPGDLSKGARWQAPLWGIGRVFALEQPGRLGGLVDLPAAGSDDDMAQLLLEAFDAADGEDQTAWRDGVRFAPRLLHATPIVRQPISFRPDATYLVTGGFGSIGLLIGRWMAQHGARHIALLGRHPDMSSDTVRAITAIGARIIPLAGDVADEASMTAAFACLAAEPPLRGVMHAAAEFGSAPIGVAADMHGTLAAKIDGTILLEHLTRGMDLDFLMLFSSAASVLGAANYAQYAAANAFLDATAAAAHLEGRRVLAANWGAWEASAAKERELREGGLLPMPAQLALDALGAVLTSDDTQRVVGRFDWAVLKPLLEARHPRPLLAHVGTTQATPSADRSADEAARAGLVARLAHASVEMRAAILADFVRHEVAVVLGLPVDEPIAAEMGFFDLGMDSLTSLELTRRLERGAGRSLPSTLPFNYPSIRAVSEFLMRQLDETASPAQAITPFADTVSPIETADLADLTVAELETRLLARLQEVR